MLKKYSAILVLLIALSVILYSPLMADDLPMFQLRVDNPVLQKLSIHELAQKSIAQFLPMGRFTFVSFYYTEWVFRVFQTPLGYKLWMLFMNLASVTAFICWLKYLRFKFNASLLLICIAAGVQLRLDFHDAFSSYVGLVQLFNLTLFATSALWLKNYREFSWITVIMAIMGSTILFMISEYALMLILLVPIIFGISDSNLNLKIRWKRIFKNSLPVTLLSFTYIAAIILVRKAHPSNQMYSGLQSNLNLYSMALLQIKQMYASLPLTNLTGVPQIPVRLLHQLTFWDVLIASILLVVFLLRSSLKSDFSFSWGWIFLGCFFWIFTSVFILPSVKYQNEISWGSGYLSLCIQSYGMAMLLYLVASRFEKAGKWIILLFILVNFLNNHTLSKKYHYKKTFPATVLWESIKNERILPQNAVLVMNKDYYFESSQMWEDLINHHQKINCKVIDASRGIDATMIDSILKSSQNKPLYGLICSDGHQIEFNLGKLNTKELQQNGQLKLFKVEKSIKENNPHRVIEADLF